MSATLANMEYVYVDILSADQLMEKDCIEFLDEDGAISIIEIQDIVSMKDSYLLIAKDEFGEVLEIELADDAKVKLYVLQ